MARARRRLNAAPAVVRPPWPLGPERRAQRSWLATLGMMSVLYGVYYFPHARGSAPERMIHGYLLAQTTCLGWLVHLFDPSAQVTGTRIAGAFALDIVKDCSSLDAQALLVAAIVAFPASWRARAAGAALGIVLLNAANQLRMLALYVAGMRAPAAFDTLHEEVMPLLLVAVACVCFGVWTLHVSPARASDDRAH
jgi:exosortase/archaeosortase family protein